ncbi:MAG: hypothetical protein IEMM0006_0399 [bacterium]|nr:MAG: hypothetical protein IEMM0006_0399 [bacterium]
MPEADKTILQNSAVAILAAGFSGRMGAPKLSLPFDEKQTFTEKIITTYLTAGCKNIVLVVNRQGNEALKQQTGFLTENNVSVVLNTFPQRERFYSLQLGLKLLDGFRAVFVQNIDNPFVHPGLLQKLAEAFEPGAFVVPHYHGQGGHPVLLSGKIVRDIKAFKNFRKNFRDFLQAYPKINCPVEDEKILVNINSPAEYRKYFDSASH